MLPVPECLPKHWLPTGAVSNEAILFRLLNHPLQLVTGLVLTR